MLQKQSVWGASEFLFSVSAPDTPEMFQTLNAVLHGALAMDFVIAGAHVHGVTCLLFLSHH